MTWEHFLLVAVRGFAVGLLGGCIGGAVLAWIINRK